MKTIHHQGREYAVSSYSNGSDPSTCVAVARPDSHADNYVVRDSTDVPRAALTFSRPEWRRFISALKG